LANKQVMRNNQNKRMRGRNRGNNPNRSHNPLTRVYESNGPEVKIRGTAHHIAEKYLQLARDAQSSGDPVAAESYYQHAEHYFRLIAAAQEQFRQNQPYPQQQPSGGNDSRDESFDEGEDEGQPTAAEGEQPVFGTREPQPFPPREQQPFNSQRDQRRDQFGGRQQQNAPRDEGASALPSFITGAQPQPAAAPQADGPNGHEANGNGGDRFPLHRRRRRHRGPRGDAVTSGGDEAGDEV
jgi:hypothetical protein